MRSLLLLLLLVAPAAAHAGEEGRFTVGLRLGGLIRAGRGYADHAAVFGYEGSQVGFAFGLAGGIHLTPRLRVIASAAGALSISQRRTDPEETLRVTNGAYLLQAGFTPWRHGFDVLASPWTVAVELTAGGGIYTIGDELGGLSRSAAGPGATAGGQVILGTGAWRMAAGYTVHLTGTSLDDRLGGELAAGGHEIGIELGFRF